MINDYFCGQLRQSLKVLFLLENTQEVISVKYGEISPVPGVSSALLGVVNQRGKLLWVLDLSDLLQIPLDQTNRRASDTLTLLLLSNSKTSGQQVGCVVSALEGIISLDIAVQSLTPNYSLVSKSLGIKNISFEGENYSAIDAQAILNHINNLNNNNHLVINV